MIGIEYYSHQKQLEGPDDGLLYNSRRKFLASAGKNCLEPPQQFQTKRHARRKYLKHLEDLQTIEESTSLSSFSYFETNSVKQKRQINSNVLQNIFSQPPKHVQTETIEQPKRLKTKKTTTKNGKLIIVDEVLENIKKEDWKEEFSAGVHYWVNTTTSDILTYCPWLQPLQSVSAPGGQRSSSMLPRTVRFEEPSLSAASIPLQTFPSTASTKSAVKTMGTLKLMEKKKKVEEKSREAVEEEIEEKIEEEGTGALVYDRQEVVELFSLLDSLR